MRIEYTAVDEVQRWPRNPKDHDLEEIKKSFKRFGFVSPIIFDETSGHLVAGHGRIDSLQEMKKSGQDPPRRIQVEGDVWKVPVLRGVGFENMSEAEAYVLADNKISEIGGWNRDLLDEIIEDTENIEDFLVGTGFRVEDFPDLNNLDDIPEEGSEKSDLKSIQTCPKCGFKYEKR